MFDNAVFVNLTEMGLLILGGVMFFVSFLYGTKGNPKWLLFMSFALVLF